MRRFYALLVTTFAGGAAVLLGAAPGASADPISSCSTTTGTVVAVDFSHWGGPVARGCGVGQPTGYALLHAAGFSTAGDSHDGPAFICRIGNAAFAGGTQYPTPSAEPCVLTPPANAYWSYWLAPAGQNTWTYSSLGAMSDVPKPGEVELWSFGATTLDGASGSGLPRVTPAQVRATNPAGGSGGSTGGGSSGSGSSSGSGTSAGSGTSGHAGGPGRGSTSGSGGGSAGAGTTAGRSGSTATSSGGHPGTHAPTAHGSSPTAKAHASRSGTARLGASAGSASPDSSGSPAVVDAAPAAQSSSSTGSALPLVIAVLVVVLLAGGAGWAVRRRRQQ